MFSMQSAAKAYNKVDLESKVTGSSAHQLITLLYDGAIESLQQARMHIQSQNIQQKNRLINKSMSIINEGLLVSLNIEAGDELGRNLASLYDYMAFCLLTANKNNDLKLVDGVIVLLSELRAAWVLIDPEKKSVTGMAQATPNSSKSVVLS